METIKKVSSKNNKKEFLVYKNYDIGTNINKRTVINNITNRNGIQMDRNRTFEEYLDTISKSLFVISPPGNGVDCHRIWECLSLKQYLSLKIMNVSININTYLFYSLKIGMK